MSQFYKKYAPYQVEESFYLVQNKNYLSGIDSSKLFDHFGCGALYFE